MAPSESPLFYIDLEGDPGILRALKARQDDHIEETDEESEVSNTDSSKASDDDRPVPPITALNYREYRRRCMLEYEDGNDGSIDPAKYGSTGFYDLGLCYQTFSTNEGCQHGVACLWRHSPLTAKEIIWMRDLGHAQFAYLCQQNWASPTVPEPSLPKTKTFYSPPSSRGRSRARGRSSSSSRSHSPARSRYSDDSPHRCRSRRLSDCSFEDNHYSPPYSRQRSDSDRY